MTPTQIMKKLENTLYELQWGSIEIYVQNGKVVQITTRNIEKIQQESKGGETR